MKDFKDDGKITITPPMYLASADIECWGCKQVTNVVAVIVPGIAEANGETGILNNIESLPKEALDYIQKYFPTFKMSYSKTMETNYYANTCSFCGALIGDYYVHSEPDSPLFPISDQEAECINIEEIPLSQKSEILANFSVGVGDIILEKGRRIFRK